MAATSFGDIIQAVVSCLAVNKVRIVHSVCFPDDACVILATSAQCSHDRNSQGLGAYSPFYLNLHPSTMVVYLFRMLKKEISQLAQSCRDS